MIKRQHLIYCLILGILLYNLFSIPFSIAESSDYYTIDNSVSYHVDVNFTISHFNPQPVRHIIKPVIFNCQGYDKIPYQETSAFKPVIKGTYQLYETTTDQFGNGFYHIETELNEGESFSFSHSYDLTLNLLKPNADSITAEENRNQDEIYELYCSSNDSYYLGFHPELISAAQNIMGYESDPISIAYKVQKWISTHIKYGRRDRIYPNPIFGALATYQERQGVCWDMAELMVTFLRINNIPARMIIGITLDDLTPTRGEQFVFYEYWENDTITDYKKIPYHAWVEYYVPSMGWLACDPTWSDSGTDYFNTLDTIHFRIAGGSWFSLPHFPYYQASHIKFNPFSLKLINFYNYSFVMTILVTDSPYLDVPLPLILSGIGLFSLAIISISVVSKARKYLSYVLSRKDLKNLA